MGTDKGPTHPSWDARRRWYIQEFHANISRKNIFVWVKNTKLGRWVWCARSASQNFNSNIQIQTQTGSGISQLLLAWTYPVGFSSHVEPWIGWSFQRKWQWRLWSPWLHLLTLPMKGPIIKRYRILIKKSGNLPLVCRILHRRSQHRWVNVGVRVPWVLQQVLSPVGTGYPAWTWQALQQMHTPNTHKAYAPSSMKRLITEEHPRCPLV